MFCFFVSLKFACPYLCLMFATYPCRVFSLIFFSFIVLVVLWFLHTCQLSRFLGETHNFHCVFRPPNYFIKMTYFARFWRLSVFLFLSPFVRIHQVMPGFISFRFIVHCRKQCAGHTWIFKWATSIHSSWKYSRFGLCKEYGFLVNVLFVS